MRFFSFVCVCAALIPCWGASAAPLDLLAQQLPVAQQQLTGDVAPRAALWLRQAEDAYAVQFDSPLFDAGERDTLAELYRTDVMPANTEQLCQTIRIIEDQTEALELAQLRTTNMQLVRAYAQVLPQTEFLSEVFDTHCETPALWTPRGLRRAFHRSASQYALTQTVTAPKAFVMRGVTVLGSDVRLLTSIALALVVLSGVLYMLAGMSPRISRLLRLAVPGGVLLVATVLLVTAWLSSFA